MTFMDQVELLWREYYELSRKTGFGESAFDARNRLRKVDKMRQELSKAIQVLEANDIKVSLPRLGPGRGVAPADLGIKIRETVKEA